MKASDETKYLHNEEVHNLDDPQRIVPVLIDKFKPKSVLDVGCGIGNFLSEFKKGGVQKVLGVDGAWVDRKILHKYLNEEEFQDSDLEKPIKLDQKYDLVISLEVAEHLKLSSAEIFVKSLVDAGDIVVFSAAIPGQGGQNHVNEQPLSYWKKIFESYDFSLYDELRSMIWNDTSVSWWYRQNMVIFKSNSKFGFKPSSEEMIDVVIPELFDNRIGVIRSYQDRIDQINDGNLSYIFYLKLIIKKTLNLFGVRFR